MEFSELKPAFKRGDADALVAGLRADHPKVRNMAAYYLGRLGRVDVVPTLVAALDEEDGDVGKYDLGGHERFQAFDDWLSRDQARVIRKTLVRALAEIGDAAAMARVAEAAGSDADEEVRRTAARQLRRSRKRAS